ncbi:MAG: phosphoribosyltransferase domain-containing protein [Desulfobacterales bacterium]|nr:phosphoribosyltransferase domain-containing protein [Desulfobacterales bacterium]
MLEKINASQECSLYRMDGKGAVECIIASTPDTRAITNDPKVMGMEYTRRLENACAAILKSLDEEEITCLEESQTIVFNILRGGLNFCLREALAAAFGWNGHGSSFISAQRARDDDSPEQWHIVESDYSKVYMPRTASIVIGDVVATGTSLEHAMKALVAEAEKQGAELKSIVFFTIGSPRAAEILETTDAMCRKSFPEYKGTTLVYLDGCFTVPVPETPLQIKITGTDLLRLDAVMAPEFIGAQFEDPAFPIQRCTIYDAGSRAFWVREYLEDLEDYWSKVEALAKEGVTFEAFVLERCPIVDPEAYGPVDLALVAKDQLAWARKMLSKYGG